MEPAIAQPKLFMLLSRFVSVKKLTSDILNNASDYLFNNSSALTVNDEEVADTIEYLKDLMYYNDLTTIDDILAHFDNKKKNISVFIADLLNAGGQNKITVDNSSGAFIEWNKDSLEVNGHFEPLNDYVNDHETEPTNPTIP